MLKEGEQEVERVKGIEPLLVRNAGKRVFVCLSGWQGIVISAKGRCFGFEYKTQRFRQNFLARVSLPGNFLMSDNARGDLRDHPRRCERRVALAPVSDILTYTTDQPDALAVSSASARADNASSKRRSSRGSSLAGIYDWQWCRSDSRSFWFRSNSICICEPLG